MTCINSFFNRGWYICLLFLSHWVDLNVCTCMIKIFDLIFVYSTTRFNVWLWCAHNWLFWKCTLTINCPSVIHQHTVIHLQLDYQHCRAHRLYNLHDSQSANCSQSINCFWHQFLWYTFPLNNLFQLMRTIFSYEKSDKYPLSTLRARVYLFLYTISRWQALSGLAHIE